MEFNCFKNYTDDILPLSGIAEPQLGSLEIGPLGSNFSFGVFIKISAFFF